MLDLRRSGLVAGILAVALAGCQSRSADAPASSEESGPVMTAAETIKAAVAGHSIVRDEPSDPEYCEYLDAAYYDHRFEDVAQVGESLGWRVEGESLCIYDGATLDCYSVELPGDETIRLGPQGQEPNRTMRLVEGNPCA